MKENKERKYVVGFPFDERYERIALIRRTKPDWQKGKLNGFGGHMEEEDDNPNRAMIREFREEAGIIYPWSYSGTVIGYNFQLSVFYAAMDLTKLPQKTDADMNIEVWRLSDLREENYEQCIGNLAYLIPLCLDEHVLFTISDTYTP